MGATLRSLRLPGCPVPHHLARHVSDATGPRGSTCRRTFVPVYDFLQRPIIEQTPLTQERPIIPFSPIYIYVCTYIQLRQHFLDIPLFIVYISYLSRFYQAMIQGTPKKMKVQSSRLRPFAAPVTSMAVVLGGVGHPTPIFQAGLTEHPRSIYGVVRKSIRASIFSRIGNQHPNYNSRASYAQLHL